MVLRLLGRIYQVSFSLSCPLPFQSPLLYTAPLLFSIPKRRHFLYLCNSEVYIYIVINTFFLASLQGHLALVCFAASEYNYNLSFLFSSLFVVEIVCYPFAGLLTV